MERSSTSVAALAAGADAVPRARLAAEFVLLFVALPLVYRLGFIPLGKIPFLLLIVVGVAVVLARDPGFDRRLLWNAAPLGRELRRIAPLFLLAAAGIALYTAIAWPERLFDMPRTETSTWLLLLVLYPLLSVYPQELVYRTFFFHRYAALLPHPAVRIGANAAVFGFMHIVYDNWIAVVATAIGGLLFAWTWERSRSTLTVSVEHALFGCWMFTVGLGAFFS